MKKIVIIGANEFQNKLVKRANELGYETHVFAWEEGAVAKEEAHYFYPVSIIEKEQILNYVKKINPDGICSIGSDLAMPTVNYIADKMGLVGNTLECTKITTNKFEMRKVLANKNLPCPKYQLIKDFSEIEFNNIKFPLIVKPTDRSGSRGVYKVEDIDSLKVAIENSKRVSFSDNILIEEYIEGKEYSIEFISRKGEHHFLQVTEKFTTGAPNFIEKGHLSPARISDNVKKDIINIIEKSLDVLKVENGASHSEVKIKPNGEIIIIEIAARMGGDFIGSDMVYISTGFDFLKNVINISTNNDIEFEHIKKESIALVGFIFNEHDKMRFGNLKALYPEVLREEHINENFHKVYDSSSRNGYYILGIYDKEKLKDILTILNMEE